MAYRAKYGPLSMQMRSEWYSARQMHHLNCINGGKAELEQFFTFIEPEEREATLGEVMNMLTGSDWSGQ